MVSSQFGDTQVWLREQLAREAGDGLLAGLSGIDDWTCNPERRIFVAEDRERVVREFRERPEGMNDCTSLVMFSFLLEPSQPASKLAPTRSCSSLSRRIGSLRTSSNTPAPAGPGTVLAGPKPGRLSDGFHL